LEERKASKTSHGDFLDNLVVEVEMKESILDEAMAIDLVVALLFATYETTSALMTLGTMFISDHPHVLAELTVLSLCNQFFSTTHSISLEKEQDEAILRN
jgi:cytochrome P450